MEIIKSNFGKLAEKFGESEFNPEKNKEHEKLCRVAENLVNCFDWNPSKEDFLIVTDTKVMEENPIILKALEQELQKHIQTAKEKKIGTGQYKILTTEASSKSGTSLGKEIGEQMRDKPVLVITSMSRSHSNETGVAFRGDVREYLQPYKEQLSDEAWLKIEEMALKKRSRIMSLTKGHNPYEILTEGAALEDPEILKERADKITELMKNVVEMHITSQLGTDLRLTRAIRPESAFVEDGRVNKPGKFANFPFGEWCCSPDWDGSSGILVVDGPCGGNINQDIIDAGEPLRLTFKNGQIIKMNGGEEALAMLKKYLNSGNNKHNDAYRLAELGIGINSCALQGKPRKNWGSSEGEKKYGSCHIAVGNNGALGRKSDDPNFSAAEVHCDMVLGLNTGGEITMECFNKDGTNFKLIDNGKANGY
jgi:hypothetical protein